MNDSQLIEAYKAYLKSFNAHSITEIEACLAPDCCAEYNGKVVCHNRTEMLPTYLAHWEKITAPIELLEILPIESGVWVKLRSPDDRKDYEVEYYYNKEGLQDRHVIQKVEAWDETDQAEQ